jgi:mannose-6-phosphate isomerase-like protein (cupin superfamily)
MRKTMLLAVIALGSAALLAQAQTPPAPAAMPAPTPLHSRPPVSYQFYSRTELDKMMYRPGDTHSYVVTDHENYDVEYVERGLITNHIENHVHWLDYVTVLEGEGTLAIDGKPVDPNYSNPAEPNGTRMTGARIIPLHPGDYVVVPAGVWHIFSGTAGHTLRYVIFKQRE